MNDAITDQSTVEQSVRRIEELVTALDSLPDPAVREPARALLEVVLDLHGLALARMAAVIAASDGGVGLLQRLASDEPLRAVLLLHGLHPEPVETRVEQAIDALRPQFAARGFGIKLLQRRINRVLVGEDPRQTVFRELKEEIGTARAHIIGEHPDWLTYDLPPELVGVALGGRYRGQQRRWFALRFDGADADIRSTSIRIRSSTPGAGPSWPNCRRWRSASSERSMTNWHARSSASPCRRNPGRPRAGPPKENETACDASAQNRTARHRAGRGSPARARAAAAPAGRSDR